MKRTFTFCNLLLLTLLSQVVTAQTVGDYQSRASGNWTNIAVWHIWDGDSWELATVAPTSLDGAITIVSGHTVTSNSDRTVDQVVVSAGGVLNITVGIFTVADDGTAAVDLQINGTLGLTAQVIANAGGATAVVDGVFNWGGGRLDVPTTIAATGALNLATNNTKNLGANMINNGAMTWNAGASLGGINFATAGTTFTNNGTIDVIFTSNRGISGAPTNAFINNGIFTINTPVFFALVNMPVINTGRLEGIGGIRPTGTGTVTNTVGTIAPGVAVGSPGIYELPSTTTTSILNPTSTVEIEMVSSTTPGTGHDQLHLVGPTIYNGTLNIIDNPGAPVGIYTIITHATGSVSGTFATVNKPANYGDPIYNQTDQTVSIEKLSIVPLVWGNFTATAKNNQVLLQWSTLQEVNTASFEIEHSLDGIQYADVGTLPAKGNSSIVSEYAFTHSKPDLSANNYYRIHQIDLDGKATYSVLRSVRFNNGAAVAVQATPNPVRGSLQISIQANDITVMISDFKGSTLRTWRLQSGLHQVDVHNLPAGIYQLTFYQKNKLIKGQKMIKL